MAKRQKSSGIWVRFYSFFLPSPPPPLLPLPLLLLGKRKRAKREEEKSPSSLWKLQSNEMLRMDEKKASECSSGCQSGWTMYLDQSYENPTTLSFGKAISIEGGDGGEEEEEDLSMVSDASSGPPHLHEEDEHCSCGSDCFCSAALAKNGGKKRRVANEAQHSSFLDDTDTASSPIFSFSKTSCNATTTNTTNKKKLSVDDVLELSCGFSATKFKGKPALQKHLGYLQSSGPVKTNSVGREEGEKKLW